MITFDQLSTYAAVGSAIFAHGPMDPQEEFVLVHFAADLAAARRDHVFHLVPLQVGVQLEHLWTVGAFVVEVLRVNPDLVTLQAVIPLRREAAVGALEYLTAVLVQHHVKSQGPLGLQQLMAHRALETPRAAMSRLMSTQRIFFPEGLRTVVAGEYFLAAHSLCRRRVFRTGIPV